MTPTPTPTPTPSKSATCYKKAYYRGRGNGLYRCNADEDQSLNWCFKKCEAGFSGFGSACLADCPKNWRAMAGFCLKPIGYNRGVGQWTKCDNCEKYGLLWYPKCRSGYHSSMQFYCKLDCPKGWEDMVSMCKKPTKSRGLGHGMYCGENQTQVGLWCWNKCQPGYTGLGPLCLADCPADRNVCGGILCMSKDEQCSAKVFHEIHKVIGLVEKYNTKETAQQTDLHGLVVDIGKLGKSMEYPICP